MKVCLMYRDRDFDLEKPAPWNGSDLIQDLQLNVLLSAMAVGDEFLHRVAQGAMLEGLETGPESALYRQAVLRDCLKNPSLVKGLYELAGGAIESRNRSYWGSGVANYPPSILSGAIETLEIFLRSLKALRDIANQDFVISSEGLVDFFKRIKEEITDDYLKSTEALLSDLKLREGFLISARLGRGNRGSHYSLLKPQEKKNWVQRVFDRGPKEYTFRVDDSSEAAARELGDLNSRGINSLANAAAQSSEQITNFFHSLRAETAFYMGAINLHDRLAELGEPVCFPSLAPTEERAMRCEDLYDASLALGLKQKVVANNVDANGRSLIIVTGANKGGKTTFLRSVGLSQILMQCGMFVPARSFSANSCVGLFTHFKRKDDANMESGQLDEELGRMSQIADHLRTNSMVLFNEAFATTNEKEGSEIARQIVDALVERGVKVFCVSHLYQFASDLHAGKTKAMLFLRAERNSDGTRSYKLAEGEPLDTSFGLDLYEKIFGAGGGTDGKVQ